MMVLHSCNPEEHAKLSKEIISEFPEMRLLLLKGNLGAGKTTLIKGIVKALGGDDVVNSPSFSLINEYESDSGNIYHMDLYRVRSEEELSDLGIEEFLDSGDYCLIEWPEIGMSFFEAYPHLLIEIDYLSPKERKLNIHCYTD